MKWKGRRQSTNVEDRRGTTTTTGGKAAVGGGILGIVALLFTIFGGETGQQVGSVLNAIDKNLQQNQQTEQVEQRELTTEEQESGAFVKTVFADTEDTWGKIFAYHNAQYKEPNLVLFSEQVTTGCGAASASTGPFYCPADQCIYMDLLFFEELKSRFGAKGGDFAIAYVLAHEVGHHIQTILGTSGQMRRQQAGLSAKEANKLSVCLELQADFYAGIWAHHNKNHLDEGDIEEAMSAAHAVGDDAIQKRMQGHVVPDSFTHGTSAQRKKWFMKGFTSGDILQGDTFGEAGYQGYALKR